MGVFAIYGGCNNHSVCYVCEEQTTCIELNIEEMPNHEHMIDICRPCILEALKCIKEVE